MPTKHLQQCTISKMFRGEPPDPRFNGKGRIRRGEGHRWNHYWDWGASVSQSFDALGPAILSPQLLGSTKIKKCRQIAYVLKWTQFYHIGTTTQTRQLSTSHRASDSTSHSILRALQVDFARVTSVLHYITLTVNYPSCIQHSTNW